MSRRAGAGQWTLAAVSGDSAVNKVGRGSGMVAPGFTSKVSMKNSKTEINTNYIVKKTYE